MALQSLIDYEDCLRVNKKIIIINTITLRPWRNKKYKNHTTPNLMTLTLWSWQANLTQYRQCNWQKRVMRQN